MRMRSIFTVDDARKLRSQGYLIVNIPEPNFVRTQAEILQRGLKDIEQLDDAHQLPLDQDRDNKDHHKRRRILQGLFRMREHKKIQLNFVDFTDGRMDDCVTVLHAHGYESRPLFDSLEEINRRGRRYLSDLADAIDGLVRQEESRGIQHDLEYSVSKLMDDPRTKIITSATSYCAVSGTDDTSARPNTAALAIYVLAKNPGMHISDNLGVVHDLSHVETDPGQIIIIPGKQLSLATKNMFGATMHPIFPKEEGEERFTWRIFTYFNEETLDMLESKQQETSIHHATQIN